MTNKITRTLFISNGKAKIYKIGSDAIITRPVTIVGESSPKKIEKMIELGEDEKLLEFILDESFEQKYEMPLSTFIKLAKPVDKTIDNTEEATE